MTEMLPPKELNLNFTSNAILKIVLGFFLLNIVFLFGTWLCVNIIDKTQNYSVQTLLIQFNLAVENVSASWYSSMLLFTISIVALFCFLIDQQQMKTSSYSIFNYGWIAISMIFMLLSFDEMGSFHEMIGESPYFKKLGSNLGQGWYAFYAIIGVVALFMIAFFILKFKDRKLSLLWTIVAVLLLLSNPFQESFEIYSMKSSPDPLLWKRPVFYLLLEEGSELFASFFFLYSFLIYATGGTENKKLVSGFNDLKIKLVVNVSVLYYLLVFLLGMGITMQVIRMNEWKIQGDDNGSPYNWFPSITSYLAFLICIFNYYTHKEYPKERIVYLLFAFTSLFTSIYFGAYFYAYSKGIIKITPNILLIAAPFFGGMLLNYHKHSMAQLLFCIGILFLIGAVYTNEYLPSLYGFIGECLILISFTVSFLTPTQQRELACSKI